jgi:aminoglycoside 6-adenylyltransferase
MLTYEDLTERIQAWAESTQDVRAALLIGSRARSDHPADAWSDLDVLVFANASQQLAQSATWLPEIAPYWLTFVERPGGADTWERRTLFEGGLDVDIVFDPAEGLDGILQHGIPTDMADMLRRGVKVLVDKDGKLAQIQKMPLPAAGMYQKPTESEFINATSDFWYHTLWATKHLRRGELWWAKSCADNYQKNQLMQMLEWHARATQGEHYDTWLRGRFLDEWADPRASAQLCEVFAHYEAHDVARAIRATMHLYRWLQDETAARWGYTTPHSGEHHAAEMTGLLLEEIE